MIIGLSINIKLIGPILGVYRMEQLSSKSARLYQAVAERLAKAIAAGTYSIGERLPAERDLALQYDVSRTTVREAVIALEIAGLVDVRVGSGVYVTGKQAQLAPVDMDIGAFELTEARLLVEGEVAAQAAVHITDAEIEELEKLLVDMSKANQKSAGAGELVDQQFHEGIARMSRNGALEATVQHLWMIRNRSPQCIRLLEKTRNKGYKPVIDEHVAIVTALKDRDPNAARAAMRDHLSRVLNYLLDASEVEALEEAKAKLAAQRSRFGKTA
jgi:GntR family transcriptional regulator, hexuronate regulon transcriptional repressor